MVEPGGFEPPSAQLSARTSTSVSRPGLPLGERVELRPHPRPRHEKISLPRPLAGESFGSNRWESTASQKVQRTLPAPPLAQAARGSGSKSAVVPFQLFLRGQAGVHGSRLTASRSASKPVGPVFIYVSSPSLQDPARQICDRLVFRFIVELGVEDRERS